MNIRVIVGMAVGFLSMGPASEAQDAATGSTVALTWIAGSTTKVEQLIGDCDYSQQATTGVCVPTASRTLTRSRVLGTDLGSSFESTGRLIFLFGDTIGPATAANYNASDTLASTTSTRAEGAVLDFFTNTDGTPYFMRVPGVRLGASEVPEAGIRLNGQTYVAFKSGTDINAPDPMANAYSVLTQFDEANRRFTLLRTLSAMPNGRFVSLSMRASGNDVYLFGLSAYRASNVYLASVPASTFSTGTGTKYFAGLVKGSPTWSSSESAAVPIVVDNPLGTPGAAPTIGNVSVVYSNELQLWLMTYDGGSQSSSTQGFYFTYARDPWGPWSAPQQIFNARRDNAIGTYIHDPRITPNPPGDGLNGPTIGPNDPYTTNGGAYAPFLIERFLKTTSTTLSIYYTLSTWNPYTIVMMRSDFAIGRGAGRRRAARH